MGNKEYVNIQEAAEILSCSVGSVKRAIDSGAIPALKLSARVYRIPRSALVATVQGTDRKDGPQEV